MKIIQMTNNKYGSLTVLKVAGVGKNGAKWECKCDCGDTVNVKSRSLLYGKIKSCGCLRKIKKGEANFNKLYSGYKKSAQARNFVFSLHKEDFRKIISKNCFYCGVEPLQILNRKFSNGEYLFNGIDRKNNLLGYTKENCLPCCFICNRAKGNMAYKDFILWIKRIAKKSY